MWQPLELRDLDPDPLRQFRAWYDAAGVDHPEEMALATASPEGRPSVRMVLLKRVDERGFAFFTNEHSRKGRELGANPQAALVFYWDGRQVRVEGRVARLPAGESDAYWRTRAPASRRSAVASPQSCPVSSRAELEAEVEAVRARHGDDPPRPPWWGGYVVTPDLYEFWQHGGDRLHDRFRYGRAPDGWTLVRLAP